MGAGSHPIPRRLSPPRASVFSSVTWARGPEQGLGVHRWEGLIGCVREGGPPFTSTSWAQLGPPSWSWWARSLHSAFLGPMVTEKPQGPGTEWGGD